MARGSAIRSFTLDLDALSWTGRDLQRPESVVALRPGWGGEPNGLAIDPDGNLVTANIALGRVQRMSRDGQVSTVLEEVDGQRTTSANFVFYDRRGHHVLVTSQHQTSLHDHPRRGDVPRSCAAHARASCLAAPVMSAWRLVFPGRGG
jgi:sugar lactone lactonase YvrE